MEDDDDTPAPRSQSPEKHLEEQLEKTQKTLLDALNIKFGEQSQKEVELFAHEQQVNERVWGGKIDEANLKIAELKSVLLKLKGENAPVNDHVVAVAAPLALKVVDVFQHARTIPPSISTKHAFNWNDCLIALQKHTRIFLLI